MLFLSKYFWELLFPCLILRLYNVIDLFFGSSKDKGKSQNRIFLLGIDMSVNIGFFVLLIWSFVLRDLDKVPGFL